jgi:RES domain-containing protein
MLEAHALPAAVVAAQPRAVRFQGLTYRAINLRHFANLSVARPLFCPAGGLAGSRYIPPDGPAALYAALDVDTTHREVNQDFYRVARTSAGRSLVRTGSLRPAPLVTIAIHVRVSRLLNISRFGRNWRPTRRMLGINVRSNAELLQPWAGVSNRPTQVLGAEVFNAGFFEGILYPSAQSAGRVCLVLFRDRLLATSRVHFHDGPTGLAAQLP